MIDGLYPDHAKAQKAVGLASITFLTFDDLWTEEENSSETTEDNANKREKFG